MYTCVQFRLNVFFLFLESKYNAPTELCVEWLQCRGVGMTKQETEQEVKSGFSLRMRSAKETLT